MTVPHLTNRPRFTLCTSQSSSLRHRRVGAQGKTRGPARGMTRVFGAALAGVALVVAGCAGPGRGGPPHGGGGGADGQRGGGRGGPSSYEGYAAQPLSMMFASFDADGDRLVDGTELVAGIDRAWAAISPTDYARPIAFARWAEVELGSPDARPSFIAFDHNVDGALTRTEFSDRLRNEFASLDKNGDAQLSRAELVFLITAPTRQQGGQSQQGGRSQGGPGGGGGGGGRGGGGGGGRGGF